MANCSLNDLPVVNTLTYQVTGNGFVQDNNGNVLYDDGKHVSSAVVKNYSTLAAVQTDAASGNLPQGIYVVGVQTWNWFNGVLTLANSQQFNPVVKISFPHPVSGSNPTFTPATSSTATPTSMSADASFDIIIPANVNDVIELNFSGCISTPSGSGLTLSFWSIGGAAIRDWGTGAIGLQSVSAANASMTIPANNVSPILQSAAIVKNKVLASDIDANGNVTFRMYGANATTGSYSYTVNYNGAQCTLGAFIAKNLRTNQPGTTNLPSKIIVYPGGTKGGNLSFTTSGTAFSGALLPIDASGNSDIIATPNINDIVEVNTNFVTSNTNLSFIWLSIAGSQVKVWSTGSLYASISAAITALAGNTAGDLQITANNQAYSSKIINRVLDTDLNSSGQLILRCYAFNANSTTTIQSLLGFYNNLAKNLSFASATVWPTELIYIFASHGNWPQEPSTWIDNNGVVNLLFDSGGLNGTPYKGLTWATTNNIYSGVWTVQATNLFSSYSYDENSVWYENGTLYIYFSNNGTGSIEVAIGTNPSNSVIQSTPAFAASQVSSIINSGSLTNTALVEGSSGIYYLYFEATPSASQSSGAQQTNPLAGTYTAGHFVTRQIGVATSLNAAGPFTYVSGTFPMVNLDGASLSTCGGPYVEFTGEYYRMLYHSSSVAAAVVPAQIYSATSLDGVNWTPSATNALGNLTPLLNPTTETGNNNVGDPCFLRWAGQIYLLSANYLQGSSTLYGGITISDPTRQSILMSN